MGEPGDLQRQKIEELLSVGRVAKLKIFRDLLDKVRTGTIKSAEIKTLRSLEAELEQEAGYAATEPVIIESFDKAADYCGFSKRTLSYHIKRGNLVQNPDGTFTRAEIDRFLSEKGRKPQDRKDDLSRAELRYRTARARREEILVKELEGRLIPVETVEEQFTARAFEFTRSLLLMSRRISHRLAVKAKKPLKEVQTIIEEEVRQVLENYCRPLSK